MTAPTPERRVGEAELPLAFRVKQALSVLGGADERYNVAIDCLRETAQEVTRLTAEVERLTEYAAKGDALHDLAVKVWADDKEAVVVQLAESREANAALRAEVERLTQQLDAIRRGNEAVSTCGGAPASLPTPAPEANRAK